MGGSGGGNDMNMWDITRPIVVICASLKTQMIRFENSDCDL